jgi:formylglycine-generating enzyme required for sulfatase activity
MKRVVGSTIFLLLSGALAAACGLDTQGNDVGACDGCAPGKDGSTDALAQGDGSSEDGASGDAGDTGAAGDGGDGAALDGSDAGAACASIHGPSMVRVAGTTGVTFCIDSTEVTNLQYAAFAATNFPLTTSQSAACQWNGSFLLGAVPDLVGHGNNPVANLDWCDAQTYCAWAGKRLCGRIAGGAELTVELDNAGISQWYAACSSAGTRVYPYGATYSANACNGEQSGSIADPTIAVGTATCVGGSPGLFDMSGNVQEWADSCTTAGTPDKDPCLLRGGGAVDTAGGLRCAVKLEAKRSQQAKDIGFRCCSL